LTYDQLAEAYRQAVRANNPRAMMLLSAAIVNRKKDEDE